VPGTGSRLALASNSPWAFPAERAAVIGHVHQYRAGDAKKTVDCGDQAVGRDTREYFDQDELGHDGGWNQFEHDDRIIQRRGVTYDSVTEISVPEELGDPDDSDNLPGLNVQLISDGGNEFVENVRVVEVTESPA
jgi:hypothetical protein